MKYIYIYIYIKKIKLKSFLLLRTKKRQERVDVEKTFNGWKLMHVRYANVFFLVTLFQ